MNTQCLQDNFFNARLATVASSIISHLGRLQIPTLILGVLTVFIATGSSIKAQSNEGTVFAQAIGGEIKGVTVNATDISPNGDVYFVGEFSSDEVTFGSISLKKSNLTAAKRSHGFIAKQDKSGKMGMGCTSGKFRYNNHVGIGVGRLCIRRRFFYACP